MTSLKKIQLEKITSKNTNRALRDASHLRNNYAFIVRYCW